MTPTPDEHSLVGAYATDALNEAERSQFERHLAECRDCAEELRGFVETTARLAAAVPAVPPEELKRHTLAAAARTRQLPALPAPDSGAQPGKVAGSVVGRVLRRPGLAAATSRARIAAVAAAIILAVLAAGVFADTQLTTQHRLHTAQRNDALVETVLSAPDATLLSAPIATGGTAHVVMATSKQACVFSAAALRPLDRTKGYELWLIRRGRDEPNGTLPTSKGDTVGPISMGGIQPGDVLGISVEPARGSQHPTTPMIVELAL